MCIVRIESRRLSQQPHRASEILSTCPTIAEILWNFARYTDDRRITLRQNPQFYLSLPRSGDAYEYKSPLLSVKDLVPLRNNDTVYVVIDKPSQSRVFLHAGHECRIFGNVWMTGDTLVFKGFHNVPPSRLLITDVCQMLVGA